MSKNKFLMHVCRFKKIVKPVLRKPLEKLQLEHLSLYNLVSF